MPDLVPGPGLSFAEYLAGPAITVALLLMPLGINRGATVHRVASAARQQVLHL